MSSATKNLGGDEKEMETGQENTENNFKDDYKIESVAMAKKRIYNPKTGTYYAIRQRTTKKGKKGQIIGKWKRKDKGES